MTDSEASPTPRFEKTPRLVPGHASLASEPKLASSETIRNSSSGSSRKSDGGLPIVTWAIEFEDPYDAWDGS